MRLSIIIPAFNEEKNLANTIRNFDNYLKNQNYDFEIIVVDDGSTDKTVVIAHELSKEFLYLKIIGNKINKGKGAAVRQGFASGQGQYRLFIDADNATELNHLDKVWPLLKNGADIVIASRSYRDHPDTVQQIKQALWKRSLGLFGNRIIQLLTVRKIWDTQCGFKIFSQKALEIILPRLTIDRWAFDAEMLVVAQKYKLKIGIIPVVWKNSDFSRVGIKGYFSSFKEIIKIKINLIKNKYD